MDNLFTKVLQICVVVDDLMASVKRYNDVLGIGPWGILDFNRDTMSNVTIHGKPAEFSTKIAVCEFNGLQIELIQPLDEVSVYAEFLRKNGPGLHHIAFATTKDFKSTVEALEAAGAENVQTCTDSSGMGNAYMDLMKDYGLILEIYDVPENFKPPKPDVVYPEGSVVW